MPVKKRNCLPALLLACLVLALSWGCQGKPAGSADTVNYDDIPPEGDMEPEGASDDSVWVPEDFPDDSWNEGDGMAAEGDWDSRGNDVDAYDDHNSGLYFTGLSEGYGLDIADPTTLTDGVGYLEIFDRSDPSLVVARIRTREWTAAGAWALEGTGFTVDGFPAERTEVFMEGRTWEIIRFEDMEHSRQQEIQVLADHEYWLLKNLTVPRG